MSKTDRLTRLAKDRMVSGRRDFEIVTDAKPEDRRLTLKERIRRARRGTGKSTVGG